LKPLQPGPLEPTLKDLFKRLTRWQQVLTLLPLALLAGGAIGGAAGGVAAWANLRIAQGKLATGLKVAAMLGTTLAAGAAYLLLALVAAR
jgi:hypothetical protein